MRIPSRALAILASLSVGMTASQVQAEIPTVQHIVIVFQENRTPDNLFHGLARFLPGADIADSGQTSSGQTLALTAVPLANSYDLSHAHLAFEQMWNNGKMNGADLIACRPNAGTTCPADPQFKYVAPAEVAPYFYLAVHYGFANRMFQSNQGPSLPAHQFILGGTSQPTATSLFFASENPDSNIGAMGCDALATTTINLVGPSGMTGLTRPCFEHATLTDLIDHPPAGARQGITWRYYAPSEGSLWTAPDAVRHMCQPAGAPAVCTGPDWTDGHIVLNPAQVLSDIAQNHLASVSWVMPTGPESDHAASNDGSGPSWVASIVNAIGAGPYWKNTVILIAWDDWGGWYDHVAPPIDAKYGYYENGFRVPLIVVSAYTPAGYVSRQIHTFGSILKFVETAFSLPPIPPGTFVDSRSDDLSDFFDFNKPPRPFVTVPAPMGPDVFLRDHRPSTDPDTE